MEPQSNKNRPPISDRTVLALGILVAIVLLAGMGILYKIIDGPDETPTPTPNSTATPIPTPTSTPIVIGWRELGYLTSAEFTATTIVELQKERFGPDETILLMAVGKIQTGIDMSQIKDTDVKVEGTTVEVILPRAIVTSIDLIPGEARIFDKGWFPGEGLETEALDQARTQLKDWAAGEGNLFNISEKLAKAQLENFLRQLGFENINITFKQSSL